MHRTSLPPKGTPYQLAVAAAVEAAIADAGTTYSKVAIATGITQPTLHRRLKVKPGSFKMEELELIADHLRIPVEQLSVPERAA
jgi:hypothetical protein